MARGRRGAYKAEKRKKELTRMAKKEAKKKRRLERKIDDAGVTAVQETGTGTGTGPDEEREEPAEGP